MQLPHVTREDVKHMNKVPVVRLSARARVRVGVRVRVRVRVRDP